MNMTIMHIFEYHAINPKEMTSEMKSKIERNTRCVHNMYYQGYSDSLGYTIPHLSEYDVARANSFTLAVS
jgi:hypothetical protein